MKHSLSLLLACLLCAESGLAQTFVISPATGALTAWNSNSTTETATYWTSPDYLTVEPFLILTSSAGNTIKASGSDGLTLSHGDGKSAAYTLSTASGYIITDYSFRAEGDIEGLQLPERAAAADGIFSIDGLESQSVTAFTLTQGEVTIRDFRVNIAKSPAFHSHLNLFPTPVYQSAQANWVPYRIPAIAQAKNGNLIAVADYRYSTGDIGTGVLDLRYRISRDNGLTWSDIQTLIRGHEDANGYWGYGDPAIVADRESNRVLLLCCEGDITYQQGSREHHQGISRIYSDDGGETWTYDANIEGEIYSMFDASETGTPAAMFVGSGRVFQSSTLKVDDYYRLYCSVLYKDVQDVYKNYVIYSDDFGESWAVLGGVNAPGITSGADEPKVEELPDGSVLLSSRIGGGRYYNIYTFTNPRTAEGNWGEQARSTAENGGVAAAGNSTNGEVMIVAAERTTDGAATWVVLQSVPFGPGRANVGIYYKELGGPEDYGSAAEFARDWDGRYQVSYTGSAYSTLARQRDGRLGFLVEEETYGTCYTIVYYSLSLEEITGGLFKLKE